MSDPDNHVFMPAADAPWGLCMLCHRSEAAHFATLVDPDAPELPYRCPYCVDRCLDPCEHGRAGALDQMTMKPLHREG
jgi:hypothetical protein